MANTKARLNPAIWPATARTDATSGELFLGGLSVSELTERFGTPVFILDEADFRARAVKFKEAMEKIFGSRSNVYYASKAFTSIATAKWLAEDGVNLDVCTGG